MQAAASRRAKAHKPCLGESRDGRRCRIIACWGAAASSPAQREEREAMLVVSSLLVTPSLHALSKSFGVLLAQITLICPGHRGSTEWILAKLQTPQQGFEKHSS